MSTRRVLSAGQCNLDHGTISHTLRNTFGVEVVRASSGAPSIVLHDSAARLAADHGVTAWKLSLTHTATMAEAVVIALGDS